jgi:hypothetical protein
MSVRAGANFGCCVTKILTRVAGWLISYWYAPQNLLYMTQINGSSFRSTVAILSGISGSECLQFQYFFSYQALLVSVPSIKSGLPANESATILSPDSINRIPVYPRNFGTYNSRANEHHDKVEWHTNNALSISDHYCCNLYVWYVRSFQPCSDSEGRSNTLLPTHQCGVFQLLIAGQTMC